MGQTKEICGEKYSCPGSTAVIPVCRAWRRYSKPLSQQVSEWAITPVLASSNKGSTFKGHKHVKPLATTNNVILLLHTTAKVPLKIYFMCAPWRNASAWVLFQGIYKIIYIHVFVCPVLQKSALILHAIKGERSDSLPVLNIQFQDVIYKCTIICYSL